MNATQQQIIDAFERQVRSAGYDKANLDEVSRELRISKKTIYVHFDGKRDIYSAVVARQALAEQKRLAAEVDRLPDFSARVEALMRQVLAIGRAHIAETGEAEWLHEYEIAADAFTKATGDLLQELVQGGMDAGEFRNGDAGLVRTMATVVVVEYLKLVNADPTYDRDDELLARLGNFIR